MDSSHVVFIFVKLERAGFAKYHCDKPIPLGVNLSSLTKVLKCAKDDDACTLKAADDADTLHLTYEAKSSFPSPSSSSISKSTLHSDANRISDYRLKLTPTDSATLGIPNIDYDACVTMPSSEFTRIVHDLSALGEYVKIDVSEDGVGFAVEGKFADGSILLKKEDSRDDEDEEGEEGVSIHMNQPVSLIFSLNYLVNFSKSTSLSPRVQLRMNADARLLLVSQHPPSSSSHLHSFSHVHRSRTSLPKGRSTTTSLPSEWKYRLLPSVSRGCVFYRLV